MLGGFAHQAVLMWWLSLIQLRISTHIPLNFFSNVLENKTVLRGGLFLFYSPNFFFFGSSKSSSRDVLYICVRKIKVLKFYNVFPGVPQTWHSQTGNPAQLPLPIYTLEPLPSCCPHPYLPGTVTYSQLPC